MSEMTCQDLEEILGDYFDGSVADTVLVIIERHMGSCGHCGQQVALYRATVALCRKLPEAPEPLNEAFAARLRHLILVAEG